MSTPDLIMNLSAVWNVEHPSSLIQTDRMTVCRWRHENPELPDIVSPTNMLVLTMKTARAFRIRGGKKIPAVAVRHGLCLHAQGSDGAWVFDSNVDVFHFYFSNAMLSRIAEGPAIELRDQLLVDDPLLAALACEAAAAAEDGASGRLYADALGAAMAARLLRAHRSNGAKTEHPRAPRRGGLAPRTLKIAEAYMRDHLADDVALDDLSAIAGLSPHHFCRAFKQSTGLPPHAWLVQRRLERARELMAAHPSMGLTEIALCVGYQSQAALGAAFKRMIGMTPSQWRRDRML